MKLKIPQSVPDTEYSQQFIQGMIDRMGASFHKYGAVADAYPKKINALKSLEARLDKYRITGNLEWLIDAANFAMIEFMCPSHEEAHFRPTDSRESPGRKWHNSVDADQRTNRSDFAGFNEKDIRENADALPRVPRSSRTARVPKRPRKTKGDV